MSNNRATFLAGVGGCLLGAMLPILLGAAQAPEKQFPRYSVSARGERNQQYIIVDNQKEMMHLYHQNGSSLELSDTVDLTKAGEAKIEIKDLRMEERLKRMNQEKSSIQVPPKK